MAQYDEPEAYFQQRMRTGKKTTCTPGMQEQRTHGICPGNLQRHHGIQKRPGMEMTVPGMKDHVKTNTRKWPKTTLMKQRTLSR